MHEYEKAAKAKTAEATGRANAAAGASSSSASQDALAAPGSFKWAQSGVDLEVTVQLPAGTTKRELRVEVKPKSLRVSVKSEVLVDLALYAAVRPDEMTYTLDAAKARVSVMIEKVEGVSWTRLESASDGDLL